MTLGTLAAIRAIVAVHATYNRDHLLAVIDAAIQRERDSQPVTMQFTEEESMLGPVQMKTTPRSRTWRFGSTEGLTEIGARL